MPVLPQRQRNVELRTAVRHAVHLPAYVVSDDDSAPRYCMIHDISVKGARLTLAEPDTLPETFTLVFSRNCRMVRRADGQVGVEFAHPKSPAVRKITGGKR